MSSDKRQAKQRQPEITDETPADPEVSDAGHSSTPPSGEPVHPPLWNNLITMAGMLLAMLGFLGLVTFGLFSVVAPVNNPYVDIVGYLILPGVLVAGLLVMPCGILFKSWRLHRRNPDEHLAFRFPRFDLNDPVQRRAAKFVGGATFVLLPLVGVSSYHGYHYTDSAEFCSKACHAVMAPQATAYLQSDHARVPCAECHIGEGAGWFVKSKLSGTRQVLAMWRESYSRPIPPAIHHLRPARETCERCHWPEKFFGSQLDNRVRFASDESNTRQEFGMVLKTGGGNDVTGRAEGIHMHMALKGRIEYVATDPELQEIPWVRQIGEGGEELIYRSDGKPSSDPRPAGELRVVDCMDCHNRPAHVFRAPAHAVDNYLDIGAAKIDPTLPFIKRQAVEALSRPYPDTDTARAEIGRALTEFYETQYPELWVSRRAAIYTAIDSVREIYEDNFFPSMKVDWRTYVNNIGHKLSPGCFRCHEGRHVNQNGDRISHECKVCHTFLNPVERTGNTVVIEEGEFVHPIPLQGTHAALRCSTCHDGGPARPSTCAGCHEDTTALRLAEAPQLVGFNVAADSMADLDCDSCHNLDAPRSLETIYESCTECHDPEDDEQFDGILARWDQSMRSALEAASATVTQAGASSPGGDQAARNRHAEWLGRSREALEFLHRAGPLHNYEAAIKVCEEIAAGPNGPKSEPPG